MSEFWTTVLSTAGASAIISGVITSVASIWLQHRYDEKIESFKADLSKILNEDQTRFNLWYQEKAQAIKTLYKEFSEINYLLHHLVLLETESVWQQNINVKNQEKEKTLDQIVSCVKKTFREWEYLKLYLDDKDNSKIMDFFWREFRVIILYQECINASDLDFIIKNGKEIRISLSSVMEELRKQFRETLMGQSDIASVDQRKDSTK